MNDDAKKALLLLSSLFYNCFGHLEFLIDTEKSIKMCFSDHQLEELIDILMTSVITAIFQTLKWSSIRAAVEKWAFMSTVKVSGCEKEFLVVLLSKNIAKHAMNVKVRDANVPVLPQFQPNLLIVVVLVHFLDKTSNNDYPILW